MSYEVEPFARKHRASNGATGLFATDFDEGHIGSTVWDKPEHPIGIFRLIRSASASKPGALRQDSSRSVEIEHNSVEPIPTRRFPLWEMFAKILSSEEGQNISMQMKLDAVRFLAMVPPNVALPTVEFGIEEITFEWRHGDVCATASVEGDDHFGYALRNGGRYVPGEGPEALSEKALPSDLLEYLKNIPAD